MSESPHPIFQLLEEDPRYPLEAYQFVRDALSFAQEELGMGRPDPLDHSRRRGEEERHLSGQQLCEAIRIYALDQYGYLARLVLNSWGIYSSGDFGEIVFNLIHIGLMKKSKTDRREDFENQIDFEHAFNEPLEIRLVD